MLVLCELDLKYGGAYFTCVVYFFSFSVNVVSEMNSLTLKK